MVGFDNISNESFKSLVESVANQLNKKLQDLGVCESSRFLNAYNRFQADEHDYANYIYDPDNNEDMVALLKGGYSLREIEDTLGEVWVDEDQYCYIKINEDLSEERNLKRFGWFDVVNFMKFHMRDIVTCAFLYRPCKEYEELFDYEIEPLIVNL